MCLLEHDSRRKFMQQQYSSSSSQRRRDVAAAGVLVAGDFGVDAFGHTSSGTILTLGTAARWRMQALQLLLLALPLAFHSVDTML